MASPDGMHRRPPWVSIQNLIGWSFRIIPYRSLQHTYYGVVATYQEENPAANVVAVENSVDTDYTVLGHVSLAALHTLPLPIFARGGQVTDYPHFAVPTLNIWVKSVWTKKRSCGDIQ